MNSNQYPAWNQNRGHRGRGRGRGFGQARPAWPNYYGFPPQFDGVWREYGGGYRGGWPNQYINSGPRFRGQNKRPKFVSPSKRLSEVDIGVTKYLTDHEGFNAIIKSRYSDFQVSEINEDGEVAMLTDLKPPTPVTSETIDEDEDSLYTKYNVEILPMETWDRINSLFETGDNAIDKVEVDVTGMTKEQRTKIHEAVKKAFGNSIVGSTVAASEDKKIVRFQKFKKGVRIDNRVKWIWPAEYLYFILYKENCDSMEAVMLIAEKLRVKPALIGYAGTKDRRGKTSQWLSFRKMDPRRVARACDGLRSIKLGNYCFKSKPLRLGDLRGNRFRIALRNVTASDEVVQKASNLLRDFGFINYYGLQRFGTRIDTPTYKIGIKLLQGRFQEAIETITNDGVRGPSASVLRALSLAPNDYIGALNKLPRNTRLLYLHSYQSLVWNRCVSERITRFGLSLAVGDLVPASQLESKDLESHDVVDEEINDKVPEQDTTESENQDDTKEEENPNKQSDNESKLIAVKEVTQEDIDKGVYSIYDVVMPLPGYSIQYPPNMKSYYEEIMKEDGLDLQLKQKIKSYSMSGAYRYVVIRPTDVSVESVKYDDPHADLLQSDWDLLRGTPSGLSKDGKYKAVLLTMSLPASCYATMALRELLRVDTAGHYQAKQNNYYKRRISADQGPASSKQKPEDNGSEETKEEVEENSIKDPVQTEEKMDEKE